MYNNMKPQCSNVEQKPKRTRTAFTTHQLCAMEDRFQERPTINRDDRQKLAAQLGLTDKSVKVWFQNRRMKEKRNNTLRGSNSDGNEFAAPNHYAMLGTDAAANGSIPICCRMVPVLQNNLCCQRLPEQQQPVLPYGHAGYPYPVNSGSMYPAAPPMQWPPIGAYDPFGADQHQAPVAVFQHPALPQPPAAPQEEESVAPPQELEQLDAEWVSDVLDGYD